MAESSVFQNLVGDCLEASGKVNFNASEWTPPDGLYTCALSEATFGEKVGQSGANCAWVRVKFAIEEGEFSGKTFTRFMFIDPTQTMRTSKKTGKPYVDFGLQELLFLGSCAAEIAEVRDVANAAAAIEASKNQYFQIRVKTRQGGHQNYFYVSKLSAAV